jgi:hypothetical protein
VGEPNDQFATHAIRADGNRFVAVGQGHMVVVPILGRDERSGADLPRLEGTEPRPDALISAKAMAEATRGSKGAGRLDIRPVRTEAQSTTDRPTMTFMNHEGSFPAIDEVINRVNTPAPETHTYVEVMLDAEALARIGRAIGAQEAVKLRFLVNKNTGRCDASGLAHGAIEVRPVREPDAGLGVLMATIVSP